MVSECLTKDFPGSRPSHQARRPCPRAAHPPDQAGAAARRRGRGPYDAGHRVYDDERGIGFGRPDLVLFRDRHSGIVIGWGYQLGPPSLETFLEGLLHAILPKDAGDLPPGVSYPWHGLPIMLGVDNAKHLIGMPAREAAIELGFQITPYRPGHPWEKGASRFRSPRRKE
ncbi:hypothetical protein AJ87_26915 [Rhizobium yanglingense]|nr:hypothetical protein AJ87_26915 [Rhizobium yanglingense]